jgi:prepilin-type N-terminal cleavage/methylation domain-containing protein
VGRAKANQGVTLLEVMVVVGIMGVLSAMAVPNMRAWRGDQRLRSTARMIGDAVGLARAEALRTGSRHIVFIGEDISGVPLLDAAGNLQVVVLNDGPPATANCAIGGTEAWRAFSFEAGVGLGITAVTSVHGMDTGDGTFNDGLTFVQPTGGAPEASWVMFDPDGVPAGLTAGCAAGATGSGGGAVYVTNGSRDYAVIVTPLGAVRVNGWESELGSWN